MSHTLIYVPSYFDFVRLRNYFKKEELNFTHICEYTQRSAVSRARHFFLQGEKQFLLLTERFHFYKRYGGAGFTWGGLTEARWGEAQAWWVGFLSEWAVVGKAVETGEGLQHHLSMDLEGAVLGRLS